MSWWTDNRRSVITTLLRWGLGYLLGRTAAPDPDPSVATDNQYGQLQLLAEEGEKNGKNT